jgi:alkylhydroperoxidase/carboxymuconolactone decarboxylase family protein YurZ
MVGEAERGGGSMPDDTDDRAVLDALAEMTAISVERSELDPSSLMLVRLAALVAVDAPPASYLLNLAAASDAGVTEDEVRGVLIAIAPLVGTARVVSAAANISSALGFALGVALAELEAEADAEEG